MKDILDLHEGLKAAGFQIQGVYGEAPDIKISGWITPPSKDDELKAAAFIKSFDWSDPVPIDVDAIVSRLTSQQKQKLLDLAALEVARNNPKLLEQL